MAKIEKMQFLKIFPTDFFRFLIMWIGIWYSTTLHMRFLSIFFSDFFQVKTQTLPLDGVSAFLMAVDTPLWKACLQSPSWNFAKKGHDPSFNQRSRSDRHDSGRFKGLFILKLSVSASATLDFTHPTPLSRTDCWIVVNLAKITAQVVTHFQLSSFQIWWLTSENYAWVFPK